MALAFSAVNGNTLPGIGHSINANAIAGAAAEEFVFLAIRNDQVPHTPGVVIPGAGYIPWFTVISVTDANYLFAFYRPWQNATANFTWDNDQGATLSHLSYTGTNPTPRVVGAAGSGAASPQTAGGLTLGGTNLVFGVDVWEGGLKTADILPGAFVSRDERGGGSFRIMVSDDTHAGNEPPSAFGVTAGGTLDLMAIMAAWGADQSGQSGRVSGRNRHYPRSVNFEPPVRYPAP